MWWLFGPTQWDGSFFKEMLTVATFLPIMLPEEVVLKEHYHHGNLKNEMIETAIRIISQEGFESLSLRKIAGICGVSHNAVYRHFAGKEQLIECCQAHVTRNITEYLEKVLRERGTKEPGILKALGKAYILFYCENPFYYSFLYRNSSVKLQFTMEEVPGNYPPFEVFRRVCRLGAEKQGISMEECLVRLTRFWSCMHGLISLLISPNVNLEGNWEDCLEDIF